MILGCVAINYVSMAIVVKMDPNNAEIKKDAERSRKKLATLVKKQEILLRGQQQHVHTCDHISPFS